MKKILEKGVVALCAFLVLAVVWTFVGPGWEEWVLLLTVAITMIWSYNVFDEFFATVFFYPYLITLPFLGLTGLFFAGLVFFCMAAGAETMVLGITSSILSLLFVIGGCIYYWFLYKKNDFTSFEVEQLKWIVQTCKNLKGKSVQEVEAYAYEFLHFYPKRGVLEGTLAIDAPIDPTHKLRTIKEMNEQDPGEPYVIEATNRIHEMVVDYCEKYYIPEEDVEEEV